MLAIRMQRNGRKGQAFFRVIVQESRSSPTSGKVVAYIGTYDPHNKDVVIDNEKASYYLSNGAQPSDRVARLFRSQKIELPSWVKIVDTQARSTKNPEKLRKNQPDEPVAEEAPAEDATEEKPAEEAPAEVAATEEASEEAPKVEEKPEEAAKPEEEAKEAAEPAAKEDEKA